MNKYKVGIKIEGAINVDGEYTEFSFRDCIIQLEFISGSEGIFNCYIIVEAENAAKASEKSNEIISEFLDILSFVTNCSLAALEIFVILKDEIVKIERTMFRQISKKMTRNIFIRQDYEVKTIKDILANNQKEKIYDLSLRWLRFGFRARTYIEMYTYYWLAFERLISETQIEKNCPFCGKKLKPYPAIDWDKAQKIFSQYDKQTDKNYFHNNILKARHKVFHGAALNSSFYRKLSEICPKVEGVVKGILSDKYGCKIVDLGLPNKPDTPNNFLGHYSFRTSEPDEQFAMDYPDDEFMKKFQNESHVEKDGVELLDGDKMKNW
jgi:hypothetical protein